MYKAKNILKQFLCFFDRILSKTDLFSFKNTQKHRKGISKKPFPMLYRDSTKIFSKNLFRVDTHHQMILRYLFTNLNIHFRYHT